MFFLQEDKFYDGTSIEWLDKESIKYIENSYEVVVWVDYGSGIFKINRIIKTESLSKWNKFPVGQTDEINEFKKKEIILKVQLYFALQKVKCVVD